MVAMLMGPSWTLTRCRETANLDRLVLRAMIFTALLKMAHASDLYDPDP